MSHASRTFAPSSREAAQERAAQGTRGSWRSVLKLLAGLILVQALLIAGYRITSNPPGTLGNGAVSVSDAEQSFRQGLDVAFTVTLGSEAYLRKMGLWDEAQTRAATAQAFLITANTHVGTVRHLDLKDKVFLVADGVSYPAVGTPLSGTSHHNTSLVFFPRLDMQGRPLFGETPRSLEIVIKDAGTPQRVFPFENPGSLVRSQPNLLRWAILLGTALGALLVACTPCLVGSLSVGAFSVGTSTSVTLRAARRLLLRQAAIYIGVLALGYVGMALAVQTFGLKPKDLRPIELLGGLVLLVLGLNFLWRQGLRDWTARALGRVVLRMRGERMAGGDSPLGSRSSAAMGASLAMVCSVAGAPTLTTSVLLPMLLYGGFSDIRWVFLIVVLYLAVMALPFLLITMGLGEIFLRFSMRSRRTLLIVNGLLLCTLGLLLAISPGAVADTLATPTRVLLTPFRWLL